MLDRSKPFAEVWGATGLSAYEQDGREYRLDGQPRGEAGPKARKAAAPIVENTALAPLTPAERQRWDALRGRFFAISYAERKEYRDLKARASIPAPAEASNLPEPMEPTETTDEELKALVEISGGEWMDRAAALAFLAEDGT